jgi:hypothetical protein
MNQRYERTWRTFAQALAARDDRDRAAGAAAQPQPSISICASAHAPRLGADCAHREPGDVAIGLQECLLQHILRGVTVGEQPVGARVDGGAVLAHQDRQRAIAISGDHELAQGVVGTWVPPAVPPQRR